jgi:thiol-disulfide isomerase/thioredoxin
MKKALLLTLMFSCSLLHAQSLQELFTQSTDSYKKNDFGSFLTLTQKLDNIRPSHPRITYNLASAYALNGQKEAALEVLEKLIRMNNQTAFESDSDFVSLQSSPGYEKLLRLKKELDNEVKNSSIVVSLDIKDLHPESVLYLKKNNIWLASSIRKRKIVSFDPKTGKSTDWLAEAGILSVFALKPDQDERYLWVATAVMPEMERFSKELEGQAEILKVDISTKRILERFKPSGGHVFGDLVVNRKGEVFVSDSDQPVIYKVSGGAIQPWLDLKGEAFNLQGLSFDIKENNIYISDYLKGILKIPADRPESRKWIAFPSETTQKGIDGLVYYKNSLIAIHNGVQPIRITRYFFDDKEDRIVRAEVIDNNRKELDEPALGFVYNDVLYYFGNSPWKAYNKDFSLDDNKYEAPMLFHYPLSR